MVYILLLCLVSLLCSVIATPTPLDSKVFSFTRRYPLPNTGDVTTHDPSILEYEKNFYMFRGGVQIPILRAPSLGGPWEKLGTVLDGPSVIPKGNRNRPWAPTIVRWNGRFYCFYSVSRPGERDSAIGIASSDFIEPGNWTDHGALINTETGPFSDIYPYNVSNAIDPAFIVEVRSGKPYLLFGSYWDGIFQLPLTKSLLSVQHPEHPDARHLVYLPGPKRKPREGSFMTFHAPYYYLWFSHGRCCQFQKNGFPKRGNEYGIRVGRSRRVQGPFKDRLGRDLLEGGGSIVYGSNHGIVYAPGGIGVLPATDDHPDIMYYHYLNTSGGFQNADARLGWNYLDYIDGWPIPRPPANQGTIRQPSRSLNKLIALLCMCCLATMLLSRGWISRKMMIPMVFLISWALISIFH